MKETRLDRLLSNLGAGSRSDVKKMIRGGRVTVNGIKVTVPETKVDPDTDLIAADGRDLTVREYEYWVLNKPAGILSAVTDRRRETVISYMGLTRKDMVPCGRLDIDTEGLLLVTDDGGLVHRLLAPKRHVDKVYEVTYDGTLPETAAGLLSEGLILPDGFRCMGAELISSAQPALLRIQEGKFHQVKRMFAALGCPVTRLRRLSMGPLSLSGLGLGPGEFRRLSEEEHMLLSFTGSGGIDGPEEEGTGDKGETEES